MGISRCRSVHLIRLRRIGSHVQESPGRQSRRDRRPHHPGLPGARAAHGGRLLRRRPRGAARALCRRGLSHRPAAGARELPEHPGHHRRRAARPAPRRSIPATASWPRTPTSPQAVLDAGLAWVGPPPAAIRAMGDKVAARRTMMAAGVPVVPGSDGEGAISRCLTRPSPRRPSEIGYPVLVKASAGGGGKGMRAVDDPADLPRALAAARREALERLRRRHGLPGEADHPGAARRDPGAGRQPRQLHPPGRARVLDPAPAPEADRGGALGGGHAGAARRDGRRRRARRPGGGLQQCRHRRVPARPRRAASTSWR